MSVAATQDHYLKLELIERLGEGPELFDFLGAGSLDGIWYWDLERPDHEWMSPEFWELFGIDPSTRDHSPDEWQDIIFEEDRVLALENFEKHIADPDHAYDQVVRYRHADGSTVWVRCRGIAIRDEGVPVRMLGAHNDLTPLKRHEVDLLEQVRRTEAANRDLDQFAHLVAHDLRSPLRRIEVLVDLVLAGDDGPLPDAARSTLEAVRDQASALRPMIDGFRALTGVSGPRIERTMVDAGEVFRSVWAEFERTEIGETPTIDLPSTLSAFPDLLATLFRNLVQNAIRHGGRPLRFEARHDVTAGGAITFRIGNSVNGVDDGVGGGLGLTICRRVVERHGGRFEAGADEGRFTVVFDLGEAS